MSKKTHQNRNKAREAVTTAVGVAPAAPASGTGSATAAISREDYEVCLKRQKQPT